jgi:hypothetical protein
MVEIHEVAEASRAYSIRAWVADAAIIMGGVFDIEDFADESHRPRRRSFSRAAVWLPARPAALGMTGGDS